MRRAQRKIKEVRKSSHQLFLQAKRRFQYKPNPKRSDKATEVIQSPECSSVTDGTKQEHSNDFSWLDKMVSGFEWYGGKDQQQENKSRSSITANGQPKTMYFAKKRAVLGERSLNKMNNNTTAKPVIKRSLERSIEHNRQKLHKAIVTEKPARIAPTLETKDLMDEDIVEEQCPNLFSARKESPQKHTQQKKDDLCALIKNLSTQPLEVDVTILKVEQPAGRHRMELPSIEAFVESHVHPTPQKSPDEVRQKCSTTRQLGKIRRNCTSRLELQQQPQPKPQPTRLYQRFQMYEPRRKAGLSNLEPRPVVQPIQLPTTKSQMQRSGNLTYFRETIQEEEEQRSCQTSGRLQQKFREIFVELDQGKLGCIDRNNCSGDNINDEIRYLIGPILSKIKYQEKRFTLQTFIEQGKRILSALQTHEVSKLMRCSVINRLFYLDTKRSELDRRTNSVSQIHHDRRSYSTVANNYNCDAASQEQNHTRQKSVGNHSIIDEYHMESLDKGLEPSYKRLKGVIRSDINRDPYLRTSLGRSLERLRPELPNQQRLPTKRRGGSSRVSNEEICRQAYLVRQSRQSPPRESKCADRLVQIASPIKPIAPSVSGSVPSISQSVEKELLERDESHRIDLLNERLNRYIQENHLRSAQRAGQFDSISLEFAELRKHLRP